MNVGDYVRTKDGVITRIDECLGKDKLYKNMEHYNVDRMVTKFNNFILYKEDILNSSPQIIDLIEVGDYVNGLPVIRIYNESEKYDNSSYKFSMKVVEVKNDNYETIPFEDIFKNEEIKTILTHEQMKAMQYRVEE